MLFNAKNNKFITDSTYIDYLTFGTGSKPLVLIAGLSTAQIGGMALPMAVMYHKFLKDYSVYVIDRKAEMPYGYTIEQMAADTAAVMDSLGIKKAHIVGVSQGGMIAQRLAESRPDLTDKTVFAVTAARADEYVKSVVSGWVDMVKTRKYKEFAKDMLVKMYSDNYVKKYRLIMPVFTAFRKPKNEDRFIVQSQAIMNFDFTDRIEKISCPALVIGGRQDKVIPHNLVTELAEKLCCRCHLYEEYGHAVYEEAKDFNDRILDFLAE